MLIEEIFRSCAHEDVAMAAVASIGRRFSAEIGKVAAGYGMTTGAFAAMSVQCFARRADEAEIRAIRVAMIGAQEPLLVGLQRILCIMLAATIGSDHDLPSECRLGCEMGPFEPVSASMQCGYAF